MRVNIKRGVYLYYRATLKGGLSILRGVNITLVNKAAQLGSNVIPPAMIGCISTSSTERVTPSRDAKWLFHVNIKVNITRTTIITLLTLPPRVVAYMAQLHRWSHKTGSLYSRTTITNHEHTGWEENRSEKSTGQPRSLRQTTEGNLMSRMMLLQMARPRRRPIRLYSPSLSRELGLIQCSCVFSLNTNKPMCMCVCAYACTQKRQKLIRPGPRHCNSIHTQHTGTKEITQISHTHTVNVLKELAT